MFGIFIKLKKTLPVAGFPLESVTELITNEIGFPFTSKKIYDNN